jgi:hypothetical protein
MNLLTRCPGVWLCLAASVFGVGCTANHYRKSADKDVYKAIAQRTPMVPNMDTNFTIAQTNVPSLEGLPITTNMFDFLGPDAEKEVGARVLSLEEALLIAVRQNRLYQLRKEQLYLTALNLTLARHRFTPIFTGGGQARIIGQTEQAVDVIVDPVTQQPKVLLSDNLIEQRRVAADGFVNASWLIRDIGLLTASFSADFLRYVTGDPRALDVFASRRDADPSAAAQRRVQTTDRTTHAGRARSALRFARVRPVSQDVEDESVKMLGVEAGGEGIKPEKHAARFQGGSLGVLQGTRSYILQDENGQIQLTHSVSAGLDYAAVGPEHAWLRDKSRVEYTFATDEQALSAFMKLARLEGIIPALESSHAIATCIERAPKMSQDQIVIVNLSGRGDKDVSQVADRIKL